jgi:hypothetical protein
MASFLYRDYGFVLQAPKIASIVTIFRDEFGLRASVPEERAVFDKLFSDDSAAFQDADLVVMEGMDK